MYHTEYIDYQVRADLEEKGIILNRLLIEKSLLTSTKTTSSTQKTTSNTTNTTTTNTTSTDSGKSRRLLTDTSDDESNTETFNVTSEYLDELFNNDTDIHYLFTQSKVERY